METTTSTSGKSLGLTSMILGIVTLIWSLIPVIGASAFWIAIIGLLLGIGAIIMAIKGNNPKRGIIITGLILCGIAVAIAAYWISVINMAVNTLNTI